MIKLFSQFVNEDATADLIQQKNSLSQQINDLQKKLLDVQAQIVNAQKQTLSQNPQSQIPMGESMDNNINQPQKSVIDVFYPKSKRRGGRGKLFVVFNTPDPSDPEANDGIELEVKDFEDFVESFVNDEFDQEDVAKYVRRDADGEGYYNYFAFDDFWEEADDSVKNEITQAYLKKKGLI